MGNVVMKKTKFDLLFEDIMSQCNDCLKSPYDNEEYIKEYVTDGFKVVIVKVSDDAGEYFEYMLGRLDENGNVTDWPYFESSDEFETIEAAVEAADDFILDYNDDVYNQDDEVYGEFNEDDEN